jgi:hypothetical protein
MVSFAFALTTPGKPAGEHFSYTQQVRYACRSGSWGATGRSTICIALGHLPNLVLDTGLLVVTSGVRARQFPVIIAGISSQ